MDTCTLILRGRTASPRTAAITTFICSFGMLPLQLVTGVLDFVLGFMLAAPLENPRRCSWPTPGGCQTARAPVALENTWRLRSTRLAVGESVLMF